jgi:hypothetical protein
MGLGHPERVLTGCGDLCSVTIFDKSAADQARHLQLVLDHENAHAGILPVFDERTMRVTPAALTVISRERPTVGP